MATPACCSLPYRDSKLMSLILKCGRALELKTSYDRQKSLNFGTRVQWPKNRESLTSDVSISELIDESMASNMILPNNRTQAGRDKQNSFKISVQLIPETRSSRYVRESCGPRSTLGLLDLIGNMRLSLSPRMSRQDSTYSATPSYAPFPMTKVLSNLWIGTFDDANNETELKSNGITHILSLVGHQSSFEWAKHKHCPMDDYGKTDLKAVLDEVSGFMELGQEGNNSLLVHCQSGQNRSAVIIISFLMIMHKKTLYRAHRELKKLRPIVQINVQYAHQLLKLEQELFNGVNSLPLNWMEREFDESAGEILYKYENLDTSHQQSLFDAEEK